MCSNSTKLTRDMELASAEGKNPVSATPKDVVAKEYFCGIGPFKPKCLQMFRNAKFFTFLVCCGNVLTGGGSGKSSHSPNSIALQILAAFAYTVCLDFAACSLHYSCKLQ